MVKYLLPLITFVVGLAAPSYFLIDRRQRSHKYDIQDCVVAGINSFRIADISNKNYTVQYWWGEHYSTNNLADTATMTLMSISEIDSEYVQADCNELIQLSEASRREIINTMPWTNE